MSVTLVTSFDFAVVGFVRSVNMRVLLAIRGVGKATIASFKFTLEWLLTCRSYEKMYQKEKIYTD